MANEREGFVITGQGLESWMSGARLKTDIQVVLHPLQVRNPEELIVGDYYQPLCLVDPLNEQSALRPAGKPNKIIEIKRYEDRSISEIRSTSDSNLWPETFGMQKSVFSRKFLVNQILIPFDAYLEEARSSDKTLFSEMVERGASEVLYVSGLDKSKYKHRNTYIGYETIPMGWVFRLPKRFGRGYEYHAHGVRATYDVDYNLTGRTVFKEPWPEEKILHFKEFTFYKNEEKYFWNREVFDASRLLKLNSAHNQNTRLELY